MNNRFIEIETPERIRFSYSLVESGTRMAAWLIDLMLQMVFFLMLIFLQITFSSVRMVDTVSGEKYIIAFILISYFFFQWGYYILFETILNGQTPGKKLLRISVIEENGESLKFSTIVLRNLLRVVDFFPGCYLLGGFITIIDKKSRRIGDIAAGTLVVENNQMELKEPDMTALLSTSPISQEKEFQKKVLTDRLNEEELWMLRKFLNEKSKFSAGKQKEVAGIICKKLEKRLNRDLNTKDLVAQIEQIYIEHTNE